MLSKVLGIITAGVFVGAAAVEISGYLARSRTDNGQDREPPPAAAEPDVEASKEPDKTAPQTES